MGKVCVIGSYAKALVMTTDRIPLAGETLMGRDYRGTYGGKGSDMAVQAARLGAEVTYIGVVGNDPFGQEFMELMKQEGVDLSGLRVTEEAPTGTGFIIKDVHAKNIITVAGGANDLFSEKDIDRNSDLIEKADVVLAQLEIPLSTSLYALKCAKKAGKITILNPAPAVDLSGMDLSDVDILTPNETEARVAANVPADSTLSDREVADLLLKTGCKKVIMTLGEKGAAVFEREQTTEIAPCRIEVVDSNGAGDCFNAALSAGLAEGLDLSESVRKANATAALCCTVWETIPSYHTAEEVETFLREMERMEGKFRNRQKGGFS